MTRIFISYDRADDSFAHRIADDLRANGFNVWRDVDDIPVGVEWESVTDAALKQCDVMLLVISPDSMENSNIEHQWQHFLRHNKQIIPLLHRTAELPTALRRLQLIDFQQSSLSKRDTLTDAYQLALCALQTKICQRNQPSMNSLAASTPRGVFGSRMTILAVIVIGSVVLSAIFAPIVINSPHPDQQSQIASPLR